MIPRLLGNISLLTAAQVIARARGLILLPIMARDLGTASFGVWTQVSVIVYTLSPLVTLGTGQGVLRLLPGLDLRTQRERFTAWFLFCAGVTVAVAAAILMARRLVVGVFFGPDPEFLRYIALAAASLVAAILFLAGRQWFVLRNDGPVMAGSVVAQAALGIAATIGAVALGGGLYAVVAAGVAADLVIATGIVVLAARRHAFARPDFTAVGATIRFGLPFIPAGYAMWALNWVDRVFLVHYRGLADVGVYTAAYSLAFAVIQLVTAAIWEVYPANASELYAKGDARALERFMHLAIGGVIAVAVPAVAGLLVLGRPIMTVVAGPGFAGGALVLPVVAAAYLCHMLASFAGVSLGLIYRQHLAAAAIVLAAALNLALNFLWIPRFGIAGAAFATLAGFGCQLLVAWVCAARGAPLWRDLGHVAKVVVASLAMAAFVLAAARLLPRATPASLAALVAAGAALYAGLALLMGIVSPASLRALRR